MELLDPDWRVPLLGLAMLANFIFSSERTQ